MMSRMMLPRFLAILAVLHGAVFLGAGNALEHLFHEQETSEHHAHHHEQKPSSDDEWINCMFCLDGLTATGELCDRLSETLVLTPQLAPSQHPAQVILQNLLSFQARAPPETV